MLYLYLPFHTPSTDDNELRYPFKCRVASENYQDQTSTKGAQVSYLSEMVFDEAIKAQLFHSTTFFKNGLTLLLKMSTNNSL
jgi:tripartite-type tricarboxylate transporter receptor subunit TctC